MAKLKKLAAMLVISCCSLLPVQAQKTAGWRLDKMPADLETALALSALPSHLRAAATVYLLDPGRGYYVAKRGSNGFVCFIDRTDWEWGEFRKDVFAPMAYDPEGARTIFPVYRDVAAMRASGKFTAAQIKEEEERGRRIGKRLVLHVNLGQQVKVGELILTVEPDHNDNIKLVEVKQ